jgi:Lon protease-like protein
MFELPLFPLNTVLFPGMPLHLHIFEDRYKQMIRFCLDKHQPFGVVLIRRGLEAHGPLAEPFEIGCTARIVHHRTLDEGRMNIIAVGEDRFRIQSLETGKMPYLIGWVDQFPLDISLEPELGRAIEKLKPWLKVYLQLLPQEEGTPSDSIQIPDDPRTLIYLAAILLQVPPLKKQEFLSAERAGDLLAELQTAYRREIALLRTLLSEQKPESEKRFSKN